MNMKLKYFHPALHSLRTGLKAVFKVGMKQICSYIFIPIVTQSKQVKQLLIQERNIDFVHQGLTGALSFALAAQICTSEKIRDVISRGSGNYFDHKMTSAHGLKCPYYAFLKD